MKKVLTMLSTLILITVSFGAIKKGPYLIFPGSNTEMTVLWQLSTTETSTLEWGTDLTYSVGSVQTAEYGNDHQHKYTITNLTPGTKYYYKVTIASGTYTGTFKSAPENQDVGNLKFFAYGDTRSYPSTQNSVTGSMINMYESDPAYQTLCLLSGDYISVDGESDWGDDYFNRNYANNVDFLENIPVMGVIGNHEGSGTYFKKYYPYPHVSSFYFSFDYGPLHVVCIDQFRASYSPGSAQYNWLENDLASSTKEWKVIVLHSPGWSAGGGHSNDASVQNYIQPLCKQYGVDIVFGGDNHYYSRAVVDGVQHITTGGGGAPLYSPSSSYPNIVETGSSNHFCKIDIQGYDLTLVAVTPSGTVYDSFSIQHTPPIPPSVATNPNPQDGVLGAGINSNVSWTAGNGAASHDVYFGTTIPLPLAGNQSGADYDPGVLQPATTYYWRVDEVNSSGTTEGPVWSFTTTEPIPPLQPENVAPLNNSTEIPVNASISWNSAEGADSYDVYFGTSSPAPFKGSQSGTAYIPSSDLSYNTTYYWSVKSVNEFGNAQGPEWSFTTEAAPPHNNQLAIVNGYYSKNNKTLIEEGILNKVTRSDNDDIDIEKGGYYQTLEFENIAFPENVTIQSVVVHVEHHEESGFSSGSLSWDVGTGWPNSSSVWGTAPAIPIHTSDRIDSWDMSDIVTTPEMVNSLELKMQNNDANVKFYLNYAYLEVKWKEGAINPPSKASNPGPMHTEIDVPVNSILTWIAGDGATDQDVYFGTTSPGAYQGSQSGSSFDPGILSPNTTYYWRIDEKNAAGTTTGDVWSFVTVAPIQYTLDVNSLGDGSVSVEPFSVGGVYEEGAVVTITATANVGSQFDGWSGGGAGMANPITVVMDDNKTVIANFSVIPTPTYTLTANVTGNGSLSLDPQPVNGKYEEGTVVTVTASPDAGNQFDGWSGDLSGTTNPVTITMNGDKNITAAFSLILVPTYSLAANVTGAGSVSLDPQPVNGKYEEGTVVTVTVSPNAGNQFDGWSGDLSGTTNPVTITMNGDKNITAAFSLIPVPTYSLAANVTGAGSVSLDPQPVNGKYEEGTVVTVTAFPNAGNQFDGWSGDLAGTTNPVTITMSGDKNITAAFSVIQGNICSGVNEWSANDGWWTYRVGDKRTNANQLWNCKNPSYAYYEPSSSAGVYGWEKIGDCGTVIERYTLSVNIVGNGSISLSPAGGVYDAGTIVTVTATADVNNQFDGWSGDTSSSSNTIEIIMDGNKSVTGNFSAITVPQYTLTINLVGEGAGTVTPYPAGGLYDSGTVVTLSASADDGSQFDGWSGDVSGSSNTIEIVMNGNKTVTSSFSIIPIPEYSLTVSTVGQGTVTMDPVGGTYPEGTVVTLTAVAEAGNQFSGWSGDLSGTTNPVTITISGNRSISATFQSGGGICDGVSEWSSSEGWWSFSIGDLRTNANQLWRCINPTYSYIEPSSSSGHYGWENVGDCN